MQYVEYFDLLKSGYKSFSFILTGIWFLIGGIVALVIVLKFKKQISDKVGYSKFLFIFICVWTGFSLIWTSVAFYSTYDEYLTLRQVLLTAKYQEIEGQVMNFADYQNDKSEGFNVNGVYFWYSPYLVTNAFNQSKLNGGPLDSGKYVRIDYYKDKILRLWIAE